jgi:hypothetical protein
MDTDEKLSNFIQGIKDVLAGMKTLPPQFRTRFVGYAEGVDAAQDIDFDPADYDAEDLFAGYFG